MATNKRTLGRIGFYCGLIVFLGITLFPFFVMLMTSFKSAKEAISLHPTLLPQQWTLEHYIDIFNPMIFPFVDYFRNSLVVSVTSSVVAVFLGVLGAYALSRLRFKGRMTINASFYTVYMFSGILLVVPLFKIITALGIYDTEMALIIT
ncbi:carbohydrate ABC transporter permease, partial [Citrobacter freundii]|nr:carbohydrate ABC transporter permease [Citrobacter freundii]HAU4729301.1 carbohydrate ABC transporter permease [Citrobacter freundii]